MWTYNSTDELYHHGIKGQKWGVRRTPEQLGHKRSREADELNKEWGKLAKAKAEMLDRTKISYVKGGSGRPIVIGDPRYAAKYERQRQKTQALVDKLEKKQGFKVELLDNDWDEDGHMYTTTILSKMGETYASELYNGRYR